MIRFLQNIIGVNVDAQKKVATADIKRGTFVYVNEKDGVITAATDTAAAVGFAVRDVVVDDDVANGVPIDEYGDSQDVIKVGEYCGIRIPLSGERFATTEYDSSLADAKVEAGKFLAISGGKLVESASNAATKFVSLGWVMDGTHKLLGFKIL